MAKLLMITGIGSAKNLVANKKGAFDYTLQEFNQYWDRIDIFVPWVGDLNIPKIDKVSIHVSPFPRDNILFSFLGIKSIWDTFCYLQFLLKEAQVLHKKDKFDLITVHDYPPFYNGFFAWRLWRKIKVPYVLEIFHVPGCPKAANLKEWFYKLLFILFIKTDASQAKAVRVMNNKVSNFVKKCGVPKDKVKYIPAIYLDQTVFWNMNLPKEYDIVFVGRLEKNKGIDIFIDAIKILKVKKNIKALIVGGGPLMASLKNKVERYKLKNNVSFHGWAVDLQKVAELINKSKILVMSSYSEGGPRVVVEAMACGIPVLATPVGIVPDIIKDKESGRIIDWDSEDIAEKALDLLSNDTEYKLIQKNGMKIAEQFEKGSAIKNYADKLLRIYSS